MSTTHAMASRRPLKPSGGSCSIVTLTSEKLLPQMVTTSNNSASIRVNLGRMDDTGRMPESRGLASRSRSADNTGA